MDRREEAVVGAHIGQHFDVQIACQFQTPVARARAGAAGETLARVSILKVSGVELRCRTCIQSQGQRTSAVAVVIDRVDLHVALLTAQIDHSHESLTAGRRFRGKQGQQMLALNRVDGHLWTDS